MGLNAQRSTVDFLGQHTSAFEEKLNPREVENLRKNWQSFALSHRRQSQVAKTTAKHSLAHQKSRQASPLFFLRRFLFSHLNSHSFCLPAKTRRTKKKTDVVLHEETSQKSGASIPACIS